MAARIKRDDGWYDDTGRTICFTVTLDNSPAFEMLRGELAFLELLAEQSSEAMAEIVKRVEARVPSGYFLLAEKGFVNPRDPAKLGTEFVWRVFKKRGQ